MVACSCRFGPTRLAGRVEHLGVARRLGGEQGKNIEIASENIAARSGLARLPTGYGRAADADSAGNHPLTDADSLSQGAPCLGVG